MSHLTSTLPRAYCRRTKGEYMSSLPLLPLAATIPDKPRLIGIARLASEGESLREGHHVEYFTLPSKSLLNRCVSNRQMPFTWTINPYRGCEFACKYCYARYTHEFMEMRDGLRVRAENLRQAARRRIAAPRSASREARGSHRTRHRHRSLPARRAPLRSHARQFSKSSPAIAATNSASSASRT